ncbi:MAG: TonB family protein [Terriglobales bacterium]
MSEAFGNWTGRALENNLVLAEYVGGTAHKAVYRTTVSGQSAAIKLIQTDPTTSATQLSRIETAGQLSHPHLLRVLQTGRTEIDGSEFVYIVTEYAEENLGQVLPDRALTKEEARQVVEAVLKALAYLHEQGLVHADLKPANIMAVNDQLKLSVDGIQGVGEPLHRQPDAHDPPESAKALSPASDVWSVGMTLVEVLTRQLPPKPASDNIGPAVPESVPAPFREIAQHCLLHTPELRWSIADISGKLNPKAEKPTPRPAASVTAPVPPKVAVPRTVPAARLASKRPFVFVAIVAVIIVAIVAISRMSHDRPAPPVPSTTSVPQSTAPAPQAATETPKSEPAPETANSKIEAEPAPVPAPRNQRSPDVKHITDEPAENTLAEEPATPAAAGDAIVQQVMPEVIRQARNSITGKVRVRVQVDVDRTGNVVDSRFLSAGPSKYFARAAMQAAREWKFIPASTEARAWNLEFDFRRTGTQVHSSQQK